MAFIRSFGVWLPERIVTSDEAAAWVGTTREWVVQVSGIEERRFAGPDETVASMAARAGQDCLERAGVAPPDVRLVIVSSGSAERQFPGPAAETAHLMGMSGTPALDLPVASAGSLHCLILASELAPSLGPVLVIASEKMSRLVEYEPKEKGVAVLFGDGAGAALVHPQTGFLGFEATAWGSDGSFAKDLLAERNAPITMNGRSVILQASRKIPAMIRTVLEKGGVAASEAEVFLMHQANQNLIDKVADSLGVPASKFYSNIRRYGNTSSASMLIAAHEWREANAVLPADALVVFASFGAGFHYSAALTKSLSTSG